MQAIPERTQADLVPGLMEDFYAVLVHLLKNSTTAVLGRLDELELSITHMKALHLLDRSAEELTLKQVSEHLGLSLAAISRSADALHRRGLIDRREDDQDRRMKRVGITDRGRTLLRDIDAARLDLLSEFVSSLSPSQQRHLAKALAPIAARADIAACRPQGPRP